MVLPAVPNSKLAVFTCVAKINSHFISLGLLSANNAANLQLAATVCSEYVKVLKA